MDVNVMHIAAGTGAEARIKAIAASSPVVVFGRSTCPHTREVLRLLAAAGLGACVKHVELGGGGGGGAGGEGRALAAALARMHAGAQGSAPYVYVSQVMVGGCSAVVSLLAEGELLRRLGGGGGGAGGGLPAPPLATDLGARLRASGVVDGGSAQEALGGPAEAGGSLLLHPEAVDARTTRLNAAWTFATALLVSVFFDTGAARWALGVLALDLSLRALAGPHASALGGLSAVGVALADWGGGRPVFVPGPPQQLGSLLCCCVAALGFAAHLGAAHQGQWSYVGLALSCLLGALAAAEAAGWCAGAALLGALVRGGALPPSLLATALYAREEAERAYPDLWARLPAWAARAPAVPAPPEVPASTPTAAAATLPPAGQAQTVARRFDPATPTAVDVRYKVRPPGWRWDPLRHCAMAHCAAWFGTTGLAAAWQGAAAPGPLGLGAPAAPWQALAIASGVLYGTWLLLYGAKAALHPRRVGREAVHPVAGTAFALPWVVAALFAQLAHARYPVLAKALYWVGAPGVLLTSLVWVSGWIASRGSLEQVNAGWMLIPVVNFVPAAVGPVLGPAYRDATQLWFAWAFTWWAVLTALSAHRAIVTYEYDERLRPALGMWVAAPAVGAAAYAHNFGPLRPDDFVFTVLWWGAVGSALLLGALALRGYLVSPTMRFAMGLWGYGFPSAALASAAQLYLAVKPGELSRALAIACLFAASYLQAGLLLHSLAALIRLEVFVPVEAWGPLSFLAAAQEALGALLRRLAGPAAAVAAGRGRDAGALAALRSAWSAVSLLSGELARWQARALLPELEALQPGLAAEAERAQGQLAEARERISALLAPHTAPLSYCPAANGHSPPSPSHSRGSSPLGPPKTPPSAADAAAGDAAAADAAAHGAEGAEGAGQGAPGAPLSAASAAAALCEAVAAYSAGLGCALEGSRAHLLPVWAATPPAAWHAVLPLVVGALPTTAARAAAVRALLWSLPERPGGIGLILAKGLSPAAWRMLLAAVPELEPRGVRAVWRRVY
ncbi:hypothetical protein HYH03_010482 [Edaphochlamys debaryana]|uniref:Uncharacterized protein n=1 Tax=Edaphochlamys debaryana TaxID=47281 RepID=A0A836BW32_9CHLO|nr:hypothetical protein HYH03_010482 [Edaphochlamys debaryana]|eukprot:KAG2491035.1 hypothetical protein HYH03_010482 [Edaphochlamys debaryana]